MRDMDYLTVINWRKAEEVVANGVGEDVKGMKMIRMADAVSNGLVFQVPEPKSPHGVDVTPDGKYIVVAGKLDPPRHDLQLPEDPGCDRGRRVRER